MTAALGQVIERAFSPDGLGLRRLELTVGEGNKASAHLAQANGFILAGTCRAASPLRDGTFEALLIFDLLATDRP